MTTHEDKIECKRVMDRVFEAGAKVVEATLGLIKAQEQLREFIEATNNKEPARAQEDQTQA